MFPLAHIIMVGILGQSTRPCILSLLNLILLGLPHFSNLSRFYHSAHLLSLPTFALSIDMITCFLHIIYERFENPNPVIGY